MKAAEPKANPQLVHRHWSRMFNRETRESCRIFGHYLHRIIPPVPHVQGLPPAKKSRVSFQVKETWTHEFFCLASTRATCVPSRAQKIALQNAGLGRLQPRCSPPSLSERTRDGRPYVPTAP